MTNLSAFENSPPVRTTRVFEAICTQIRDRVAAGALKPGDKLPAERDLSAQFGASRTSVREALRTLENNGILEFRKGVKGGAFIRQGDTLAVSRSLQDFVSLKGTSLESLTESRMIIQESVLRLACERGTDEDFAALEECIARIDMLAKAGQFVERRSALAHFYHLLSLATGNEILTILVDSLTPIVSNTLYRTDPTPRMDTSIVFRSIVAALRARDADKAVSLMAAHLRALHDHLVRAANTATDSWARPR